jgi:hypothetical protein
MVPLGHSFEKIADEAATLATGGEAISTRLCVCSIENP